MYLQNIAFLLQRRPTHFVKLFTLRYYRSHFIFAALQADWRTEKKCKRFTAAALRSQFSMWKNYGKIFKAAVPTTGFSHTHPAALTVTKFVLALTCRIFTAVLVSSEFMQKSTSAAAAACQNPRILSIFYKYKT